MRKLVAVLSLGIVTLAAASGCDLLTDHSVAVGPGQAAVHTSFSVYGSGFGDAAGTVTVGGLPAKITSWADGYIMARVPVIATPGGASVEADVVVRTAEGEEYTGNVTVVRGILFQTNREGDWEIYVMNPDGTNPTNISRNTADDVAPDWSPDGTRIAFCRWVGNERHIYAMDADGANAKRLTAGTGWQQNPDWAPDGTWIAFDNSAPSEKTQLYLVRPDGTLVEKLSRGTRAESFPAWSPDGLGVAFTSPGDGTNEDVYLMELSTGEIYRVTEQPGVDTSAAWSPDGLRLAFASMIDGDYDIRVFDSEDGTFANRTPTRDTQIEPTWSPDGTRLVYSGGSGGAYDVYSMPASGGPATQLTSGGSLNMHPCWGS